MYYESSIIHSQGFFILTALCLSMGVQSCLDDDDNNLSLSHYYANALVTVNRVQIIHRICNWMTAQPCVR